MARDNRRRGSDDSDDNFELGDASVAAESELRRPSKHTRVRTSATPWLLLVLTLAAAGAGVAFFVLPQHEALQASEAALSDARKLLVASEEKSAATERHLNELMDKSNTLQRTVEEQAAVLRELESTRNELETKLKDEIARGDVLVKQVNGELVVDLADQILFPSGESDLNDQGQQVLKVVGETLVKAQGKIIQVGGHTDNLPISDKLKKQYPSNWELATQRALNVVHFLQDQAGLPGERLAIAGFGEYRPLLPNTSKEGRKKNRRIELVLLPVLNGPSSQPSK